MKEQTVVVSIIPDKCRKKDDGTFPLKLRLSYKGERKYYATGYDANVQDWELIKADKARGSLKKKAFNLRAIRVNAENCCNNIEKFTFTKFETEFFPKTAEIVNVKQAFDRYI